RLSSRGGLRAGLCLGRLEGALQVRKRRRWNGRQLAPSNQRTQVLAEGDLPGRWNQVLDLLREGLHCLKPGPAAGFRVLVFPSQGGELAAELGRAGEAPRLELAENLTGQVLHGVCDVGEAFLSDAGYVAGEVLQCCQVLIAGVAEPGDGDGPNAGIGIELVYRNA